MNIHSTARPLHSHSRFPQPTASKPKSGPLEGLKDTFLSACDRAAVALPGVLGGGLIGAAVGLQPGLLLAPAYGLAAPLIGACTVGAVGAVIGGVVVSGLASMD